MSMITKEQIYHLYTEAIQKKYRYSNCYFQPQRFEEWLKEDAVSCYSFENSIIFLLNETDHIKVFFMSDDFEWINNFKIIVENIQNIYVIEIVTKGDPECYDLSTKIRCREIIKYERLRNGGEISESKTDEYFYCTEKDHKILREMMDSTFRPIGDHIPSDIELDGFIKSKSIIGIYDNESIAGFIIFEDTKKTSYVRMLCVNEKYRGKGIGNKLMQCYFSIHKDFKSFTLWCRADNTPALNLYINKWNYKKENLYNYIFIV